MTRPNITSLQSHILDEEARHPSASGDLTWILSALSLAAKAIASKVRHAGIEDVLGDHGGANVHGETQQKLDVIANDILMTCLGNRRTVAVVASEEDEEPTILRRGADGGKYCVVFDPLDGSSNLDVSVSVGTIFSILRNRGEVADPVETILQSGSQQVAAGYILYGASTVFVLTTGHGVDMFVLDSSIGSFVLVKRQLRIPERNACYSVNEANRLTFPDGYGAISIGRTPTAIRAATSARWSPICIGSCSRAVCSSIRRPAGIPEGKLRLMYEGNPMAMIVEQAGGKGLLGALHAGDDGLKTQRLLDVQPTTIHQRTSVVIGSPVEVDRVMDHLRC